MDRRGKDPDNLLYYLLKAAGTQVPNDPALWRDNLQHAAWHGAQDYRVLVGVADALLKRVAVLEDSLTALVPCECEWNALSINREPNVTCPRCRILESE